MSQYSALDEDFWIVRHSVRLTLCTCVCPCLNVRVRECVYCDYWKIFVGNCCGFENGELRARIVCRCVFVRKCQRVTGCAYRVGSRRGWVNCQHYCSQSLDCCIFFLFSSSHVVAEWMLRLSSLHQRQKKIIFWPMLMIVRGWLTLDRTIYFSRHTNYMSPSFHSPFISIHLQMKSKEYDEIVYPFLLVWPSFAPSLLTPFSWHFLKGNNENNYSTVLQEWNTMKTKGVMFSTCGEIVCRWW